MANVFVSYARPDRERVRALATALGARGWAVWWDREILAGTDFDEVIQAELDRAAHVIVVWSSASVASRWVRAEASEGLKRGALIPVVLDNATPPLAFRNIQSIPFEDAELVGNSPAFEELVRSLTRKGDAREERSLPVDAPVANARRRLSPLTRPRRLLLAAALLGFAAVAYLYRSRSPTAPSDAVTVTPSQAEIVACHEYVNKALVQVQMAEGCGFTGPRWHLDFETHLNWCSHAPPAMRTLEDDQRMGALEQCRGNAGRAPIAACDAYVVRAMTQILLAQRLHARHACTFTGPRWDNNAQEHLSWCNRSSVLAREAEDEQRRRELAACKPPV